MDTYRHDKLSWFKKTHTKKTLWENEGWKLTQVQSIGVRINMPLNNVHVHTANTMDLDPTGGFRCTSSLISSVLIVKSHGWVHKVRLKVVSCVKATTALIKSASSLANDHPSWLLKVRFIRHKRSSDRKGLTYHFFLKEKKGKKNLP